MSELEELHVFRESVIDQLMQEGYTIERRPYDDDWGVDFFATREGERLAVTVKMYRGRSHPVKPKLIKEVHAAARYFRCTGAVIATDEGVLPEAEEAAEDLGVEFLRPYGRSWRR